MDSFQQEIKAALNGFRLENRLRSIPADPTDAGEETGEDSGEIIDLLSNDYLGLAAREAKLHQEFAERFPEAAFTSSASRLLSRRQRHHNALEKELGRLYGRPALLFNSGYHANTGVISALASLPSTIILADKLVHASAIDGIRLGGSDYRRFPHNNTEALRKLLTKYSATHRHLIVIAESVYSMDGDLAPLREMVGMKEEHPAMTLILDEAHGFGTFGEQGLGLAEELGVKDKVDIIIGTLGKAAASAGAFAIASQEIKEYLVNTARSFIFSTALPPAQQAWSLLMIEKLTSMKDEREKLRRLSARLREGIEEITGEACQSRSQIVPVMVGDAAKAIEYAAKLREEGFDCLPIRRPTVAAGTERLRISLNAGLSFDDIDRFLKTLREIIA